jgi:formamidopyrimidine-DNA glycosylase
MTGSLLLRINDAGPSTFIRAVLYLDDGTAVHFRDIRRFGRMWLVQDLSSVIGKLGPEPLEPEFTPQVLAGIFRNRRIAIKGLLLDQALIAGIGNMYADEALYSARIHPLKRGSSLTPSEIKKLHASIQKVLKQGIMQKGASVETYFRPGGDKGEAHLQFQVAHRKGKACPACGRPVERIVVHQRGTNFCPFCQKLPGIKKNRTAPFSRNHGGTTSAK